MMKSSFLILVLFAVLLSACSSMKVYQINNNDKLPSKPGMVYYLPKTVIYLDIQVHRTDYLKGPFAAYSSKYTGISNVINENATKYQVEDIKITSAFLADTSSAYLITLPSKQKDIPHFVLSNDGVLLSMNFGDDTLYEVHNDPGKDNFNNDAINDPGEFKYFASENIKVKTDTIFEKIVLDTITIEKQILEHSVIEKSAEDKAKDVADYLKLIAEHKLNLLSGYQEVAYSLETIDFMYKELDKLENDYLSLFTGKEVENTMHYRFAITPSIEMPDSGTFLYSFDAIEGLNYSFDSIRNNNNIFFKIIPSSKTKVLNKLEAKGKKGIYYNIPDNTRFVLFRGDGEILFESSISIAQFGKTMFLPVNINGVRFNNGSGSIRNVK